MLRYRRYDGGGNSDPLWQAVLPRLWHHMLTFYDDLATLQTHFVNVSCHDVAGIWVAFFLRCQR